MPQRRRSPRDHVVLVPGFFADDQRYFRDVDAAIRAGFERRGIDARVSTLRGRVTGSIRARAASVLDLLRERTHPGERVHLVGHSTGGLDARLALVPEATLGVDFDPKPLRDRVRSVVTVGTPHRGTPLASLLAGRLGDAFLGLACRLTERLCGAGGSGWTATLGRAVGARARRLLSNPSIGPAAAPLLGLMEGPERAEEIGRLARHLYADRGVLRQLTPESLDLFDAATPMPAGVRYGSVVLGAPAPLPGVNDLYTLLHGVVAAGAAPLTLPGEIGARLERALGVAVEPHTSDGVVPVTSQVWGDLVWAGAADHVDAIGLYEGSPEGDFLESRSRFDAARFASLWRRVADYLAPSSVPLRAAPLLAEAV